MEGRVPTSSWWDMMLGVEVLQDHCAVNKMVTIRLRGGTSDAAIGNYTHSYTSYSRSMSAAALLSHIDSH